MEALSAQRAFLANCSKSLILDHGSSTLPVEKAMDLQDVVLVNLSSLLLKSLDQLGCCKALKICILADNFLTRIDPLVECVRLVKLDLKGNQITDLPSASFWSSLKNLQLLNLHDNNLAERRNITALSSCPKLTALTLYGTPLSLKQNYRHCVVNSIWSLKALDSRVISDEEIVEKCHLPSKFKAAAPHFCVNLYPSSKTDLYKAEMKALQGMIAVINQIQANYCPILIIQKWIRGHLTRRSLGLCRTPRPLRVTQRQVTPASTQLTSRSPETTRSSWIKKCKTEQLSLNLEERETTVKKMYKNLSKLEKTDSQEMMLQEEMSVRSFNSTTLKELRMPCNTPEQSSIMNPCEAKLNAAVMDDVEAEEMDRDTFYLSGFKATMHSFEPFAEMLISRKALGQEVREAICHFHSQKPGRSNCPQPRPPIITAEKRFIGRCHNCFSLAPFRTIEKAYWAKKKAEDLKYRAERVEQLQGLRDDAHDHYDRIMESRRKEALLQQDRDKAELEEMLSLQRAKCDQEVQLVRQKHLRFLEEKRRRVLEQEMVIHFSGQHSSLAKSITRHCIQQKLSNAQQERRREVAVSKHHTTAQKMLIQRYLENRRQNIHAEAVLSRVSTHAFLSEKQHSDLLAAQARVAHIKSSHYKVEVLRPQPRSQPA
ncbi:leucine-rich repeat and IQ domain-containing protein 3 [Pygocentrus nattereri]|uniref:leucine-rich repeat and IQ domain-containing protein 3 n=1 Tax=Pygocentrus nattereri TaxID=42514 RepID=UPI0008149DFC|nr:leucine-rich repeat and IQ domain-containing protein 3 [Pygocentrus nattereri]